MTSTGRFRRALVVANPIAGRGRGAGAARDVVEGLRRRGVASELHLTRARGDGVARVRELGGGVDLVVAVGGDGTLREVLEGLPDPAIAVGLVPVGTANALSLDLGLPRDPARALDVMLAGTVTRLDVGWINGRLTFLVSGIGLDAMTVRALEERRRGPIRRASYVVPLLRAVARYRPPRLHVEIDGHPRAGEFGLVLISNVVHYAGLLCLSRARRLDDGRFEVFLFRDATRRRLAAAALRALVSELSGTSCEVQPAQRVRVTSETPVPFHVDGDYGGVTPVDFRVSERQYRLLTPRPSAPGAGA
jgi:YegS/Rv2252/BmrU family lipid kinase